MLPKDCLITSNSITTKAFLGRQIGQIRGILRAITKPTSVSQLSSKFKLDEVRIKAVIEDLSKSDQIAGKTAKGLFIPSSFSGMQNRTVKQFFE